MAVVRKRPSGSETSALPASAMTLKSSDPLVAALARYVEALHRRYPDGPQQLQREGLDGRAKITPMRRPKKDAAA